MIYENILVEYQDQIAVITINRPKALNALNSVTIQELTDSFNELAGDANIRTIILTGSGEKAFVAGADIAEMSDKSPIEARHFSQLGHKLMNLIEALPQPVIAAVNGFALGGGLELAMACDIRLASTNAKFGQPEVGLGILAGFGGTQRLPRLVGSGRASELLFTTDLIDAQEAFRMGLANHVYPKEELLGQAVAMAKKISSKAPIAIQLTKSAIVKGENLDLLSGQGYEAEVFAQTFSTEDQKNGCKAFLEKRTTDYQGR
ncbi:enoyl-CoA hydratase/carnithine racemase [Desulfitobacterium dichloroeliminans LMG P-21439]|uniref:short-chain-enoyl-CoA hydratase n=1 Tax=Desulfitobacterium dichloroeliminans (strain LMG P-21439 / DCA1) TaxID=871963 RepID=L0F898_DESDL|nr:enoyl-CoA hydratase-related protein [Desulfitobacterium dichloroeliminans]AGA69422.1 enoyl-CoA hydratase/carnithine racemase [Desulfitobacterium dichloroeliminans LMG P-21439]